MRSHLHEKWLHLCEYSIKMVLAVAAALVVAKESSCSQQSCQFREVASIENYVAS